MAFSRFWVVWSPSGTNPTKKHETSDSARTEAERLAVKHPNLEFFVLETIGSWCVRPAEPTWASACER